MGLARWRRPAMVLALACSLPAAARATEIQVRVHGVDARGGSIRATVCAKASFLRSHCQYSASAPAGSGGTVVVRVRGVPRGVFAVQVYHDISDSEMVTRNLFGVPTEGVGFSRDAPINFGPPRWADAAIAVSGALVTTDITLKFEP